MEMAFAGNCGVVADLPTPASDPHNVFAALFAEELGLILEVPASQADSVAAKYAAAGVAASVIGK
eukprot:232926-Chlamydomonas_euryale.AAC.2